MGNAKDSSSRFLSQATKILFLALTIVVVTVTADAAAPVGQTVTGDRNGTLCLGGLEPRNLGSAGCRPLISRRVGAVPGD